MERVDVSPAKRRLVTFNGDNKRIRQPERVSSPFNGNTTAIWNCFEIKNSEFGTRMTLTPWHKVYNQGDRHATCLGESFLSW